MKNILIFLHTVGSQKKMRGKKGEILKAQKQANAENIKAAEAEKMETERIIQNIIMKSEKVPGTWSIEAAKRFYGFTGTSGRFMVSRIYYKGSYF